MKTLSHRIAAPISALLYPFALQAFHASIELSTRAPVPGSAFAIISLCLAFAAPLIALGCFIRLAAGDGERRATVAAALAVAAPTLFTFMGVVLYMLHYPVPELAAWLAGWGLLTAVAGLPSPHNKHHDLDPIAKLRSVHGILAATAVLAFLGFHLFNHLMGLAGGDTHRAVIKIGRLWYRSTIVEPTLVLIMLSIAATGSILLWRRLHHPMDRFLALQAASGIYLLFFVLGHMNSVFIYARRWLGTESDWAFATGAPAGLITDAWNIRLVPHYALGVFFLLIHLAGGLRIVLTAHGLAPKTGDRVVISGAAFAALTAAAILPGMCGVRILPGLE